ncbi:hypothetical protein KFK09_018917 [Dendrobium nobile]|uniref:Uncharacterized protein n=1 Tax=Dendrobium nobile TaxID=94219 RepID=A0A8T3AX66_DENNO|nr:hypothetical protein KFK09_018917 [Dendrobium nobile]
MKQKTRSFGGHRKAWKEVGGIHEPSSRCDQRLVSTRNPLISLWTAFLRISDGGQRTPLVRNLWTTNCSFWTTHEGLLAVKQPPNAVLNFWTASRKHLSCRNSLDSSQTMAQAIWETILPSRGGFGQPGTPCGEAGQLG